MSDKTPMKIIDLNTSPDEPRQIWATLADRTHLIAGYAYSAELAVAIVMGFRGENVERHDWTPPEMLLDVLAGWKRKAANIDAMLTDRAKCPCLLWSSTDLAYLQDKAAQHHPDCDGFGNHRFPPPSQAAINEQVQKETDWYLTLSPHPDTCHRDCDKCKDIILNNVSRHFTGECVRKGETAEAGEEDKTIATLFEHACGNNALLGFISRDAAIAAAAYWSELPIETVKEVVDRLRPEKLPPDAGKPVSEPCRNCGASDHQVWTAAGGLCPFTAATANEEIDAMKKLQLLVIDLGDSCVLKVEKNDRERWLTFRKGTPDEKLVGLGGSDGRSDIRAKVAHVLFEPLADIRAAIDQLADGDPPYPRIEKDLVGDGYMLYHQKNGQGHYALEMRNGQYYALSELAGHPLHVWTPRRGTWTQLWQEQKMNKHDEYIDEQGDFIIWRYTLTSEGE